MSWRLMKSCCCWKPISAWPGRGRGPQPRERYGPNALPPARRAGLQARVGHQVNDPLIYVLLAAGAVTVALGEHVDAAVIFGVVALNTLIGYVQESRAEGALDALRALTRTQVTVVRTAGRAGRPQKTWCREIWCWWRRVTRCPQICA